MKHSGGKKHSDENGIVNCGLDLLNYRERGRQSLYVLS